MQTFLPYPSFTKSAQVLDNKRLGKQRVEAFQILKTLKKGPISDGRKTPWYNHPAVQMWKGHESHLIQYGQEVCKEWIQRGFKDSLLEKFNSFSYDITPPPSWLDCSPIHMSHRSNLLRKNKEHYIQFGWTELDDIPYYWPTKNTVR